MNTANIKESREVVNDLCRKSWGDLPALIITEDAIYLSTAMTMAVWKKRQDGSEPKDMKPFEGEHECDIIRYIAYYAEKKQKQEFWGDNALPRGHQYLGLGRKTRYIIRPKRI